MEFNIAIFFTTLFMVFIMEMGDKTQLLVMMMASKYRPAQVFWGIAIAALFLNFLAVLLGTVIGGIQIIQDSVRAGASILFIFFGLLSLKDENSDDGKSTALTKKVIPAISLAFFLAEFGDKTQLSTFSFAALYPDNPLSVFLGATLGLMATDCLGLMAGCLIIKCIPKRVIAYVSAALFIVFGLISGWTTLKDHFLLDIRICILTIGSMALVSILAAIGLIATQKCQDI
mgnify:CR=1 FL=1|jgi:putative Ca2+/H+ antiporter (TMEM165/GDT1 family)